MPLLNAEDTPRLLAELSCVMSSVFSWRLACFPTGAGICAGQVRCMQHVKA